jgi:cytochrome P450 family 4
MVSKKQKSPTTWQIENSNNFLFLSYLQGQDSVGAAIAFCLFLLAQNQDDQQKCIDELDEIFGNDKQRSPTINDLRSMKYLEMCIKETLRLYPSVPVIARTISEDIKVGKHILTEGTEVFVVPWITHRLPHIYPNPESFQPDRFSSVNCESRHPYAYIPFSAGPRNCIGHKFAIIELKVVISKVLRHYRLMPIPGKTKINPIFRVTVRATGGLWVQLQKREQEAI